MSTVLVVSPDMELGGNWSVALEAAGHTVLAARATVDGVTRLREGGIDVIVLGEQADAELDALVAALERLPDPPPFVLVSGSPRAPEISAHVGAAAFLPEPCSAGEIVDTIARFSRVPVITAGDDEPTQPRRLPGLTA